MVGLIESKGFKVKWHKVIWDLPHTKKEEKHKKFIWKVRHTLAMATWLERVATNSLGRFLIRKQEMLRIIQLRISILITVMILIFYGLPVDPNSGDLVANGTWQMGELARSRPPAGYKVHPYPYSNLTTDPEGRGRTAGTVLHNIDNSLKFRMLLIDRWEDPDGWSFFKDDKRIIYALGAVHVLLSLLRLIAYLVLEFPLTYLADDYQEDEAPAPKVLNPTTNLKRGLRHKMWSVSSRCARAMEKFVLRTICCVDVDEEAEDNDENEQRQPSGPKHRHSLRSKAHLGQTHKMNSDPGKDAQEMSRRRLQELAPPPDQATCLPLFGNMLNNTDWRVMKRQWPGVYLMFFLTLSLLGIWTSPFYFVVCLIDHFRSSQAEGADVFEALYIGSPRLIRSFSFGVIFLVIVGFYTYTYFSQTAIIEDESCHSPFQARILASARLH